MSLRTKLNDNPMLTGGIIVAIIVILVGYWVIRGMGGSGPVRPTHAYYTVDDGTSWFSGSADEIAPFQHDGKPAVRAHLYKCADGKEFVGYLERYTDQAKAVLDQFKADRAAGKQITNSQAVAAAEMGGKQVKRPGDKDWVGGGDRALAQVVPKITCADKSSPQAVE